MQQGLLFVHGSLQLAEQQSVDPQVPAPENLGGAIDRPVPAEVWAHVQAKLAGADSLPEVTIDTQDETVQMLAAKMPPMAKVLQAAGRLPAGKL